MNGKNFENARKNIMKSANLKKMYTVQKENTHLKFEKEEPP